MIKKFISKRPLRLVAVLFTAALLGSCTDLTETAYTFMDPNSFYKDADDLNQSLDYAYNRFRKAASSCRNYVIRTEILTELGEPNYRKEQPILDNTNLWNDINNASYTFSDLWKNCYSAINAANIVIGRADELGESISDGDYKKIVGQAKFLRAYSYFHLVRIYGACPIHTQYTSSNEGLAIPRDSVSKVYRLILEDLKYGSDYLPKREQDGYDVWRATCGSCDALLSEVYLYRATISNDDNLKADQADLTQAKNYAYKCMSSGAYSLEKNFLDLWGYFGKGAAAKNNCESIFELQFSPETDQSNSIGIDTGVGNSSGIEGACGAYYNRYGPSGLAYRSYDTLDVRRKVLLTEFTNISSHVTYKYDAENELWVAADGSYWAPEGYAYHTLLNAKYYDNWDDTELCRALPAANMPMLRYAEVLLNYAEASNLLKAGDGLDQLNDVHQRAGLPKLSAMSQKEMDDAILQERLWEFIGEQKVYYDELRKGVIADRAEPWIAAKNAIYEKNILLTSSKNSRLDLRFSSKMGFKPRKSFLWKIPTGDLNSNSELEQNPDNVSK